MEATVQYALGVIARRSPSETCAFPHRPAGHPGVGDWSSLRARVAPKLPAATRLQSNVDAPDHGGMARSDDTEARSDICNDGPMSYWRTRSIAACEPACG